MLLTLKETVHATQSTFPCSPDTAQEQRDTGCSCDRSNSPNSTVATGFDLTAVRQKETMEPVECLFSKGSHHAADLDLPQKDPHTVSVFSYQCQRLLGQFGSCEYLKKQNKTEKYHSKISVLQRRQIGLPAEPLKPPHICIMSFRLNLLKDYVCVQTAVSPHPCISIFPRKVAFLGCLQSIKTISHYSNGFHPPGLW